jgi:hypothetical protein
MIDIEGPLSSSALSLIGGVHIGARALLEHLIDMVCLNSSPTQWGEHFYRSNDFYLPSQRLEKRGRGRGTQWGAGVAEC